MTVEVDCRGQVCPLPVIALAKACRDLAVGETVSLVADDVAAAVDVPAWCRMKGQELVGTEPVPGGGTRFLVRRTA
jgi:tRNA 2-thiouridine synthesizing protein A